MDPLSPVYYHVYQNTLPPEVSYRIVPPLKDNIVTDRDLCISKKERRFIFSGWNNYTDIEKKWI